ncbi:MAG TPA: N-acyl-D-amino-acid deacylase [Planctomycetaceae bacterium]|nr:N-acyl-D-amino-acid deacylase [Planctomycetaceae bacterium]HCC99328.1 N-acyl-D-amino-acid deacylase [Planctomycetaceae bacterium]|tara:strand:- start:1902 stop:3464 length:1563 start_codon:yes stop_codon:yes gene_type:complete
MHDLILHGGTVIDGTGGDRYTADVGLSGDRITSIGELSEAESVRRIDVSGRIVAPGFIDVHNHSDGWLLKRPHFLPKTSQGFTTEVLMLDGISYAPVSPDTARQWLFYLRGLNALRLEEYRGWESIGEFLAEFDRAAAQNVIGQVPYANVRSLVCGFGKQWVDDLQMKMIQTEVHRGMQEGAVGISTGLDYIVQCYTTTDELVEACKVIAEYDGVYTTHVRYKKGILDGIREAVEIGKRSGCRVHISHVKGRDEQTVEALLSLFDEVSKEVEFSYECYPYQPGSTMLNYLLPYEAWDDGPLGAMSRLHDPAVRAHFRQALESYPLNLDRMTLAWVPGKENTVFQGQTLDQYVEQVGLPVEEALYSLLIEERLAPLIVFNEGEDRQIEPLLQHERCVIGSDGIYHDGGIVHPRVYGTAPRIIGSCVRDRKLFSLEEAVAKLTSKSADVYGLKDRGRVVEGGLADLVVFDADTVADRATYENPHQTADGIDLVVVNGEVILETGQPVEFDGPMPGRSLRYER